MIKNKYTKMALFAPLLAVMLAGCGAGAQSASNAYSGVGGMTQKNITPEVYIYHYENGFTGVDAMGWDPNLQYAWSRAAAAKACGMPMQQKRVISQMIKTFGYDAMTHELLGIGIHEAQIDSLKTPFCTDARLAEIQRVIPQFQEGKFPKKYEREKK